jgi:hypothetical protein
LPKPHKPPHEPKLCQRACKLPHEEKKFLKMATARGKDKMNDIEIKIKSDKKTKHETLINRNMSGAQRPAIITG